MNNRRLILMVALAGGLCFLTCGGGKSGTEPTTEVITMSGWVTLPYESTWYYSDLSIGFGAHDSDVDDYGDFDVDGNKGLPGLAVASAADDSPLLLAIVPDPSEGGLFEVDVHSTAVAMVFLHPFICTDNPEFIDGVLSDIENLPELADLVAAIESTLVSPDLSLSTEDEDVSNALEDAVTAYIDGFVSSAPPGLTGRSPLAEQVEGIEIEPDYQVGGLRLVWKGGNTFELTNHLGRWGYCTTPEDSFFVFPNGDFLDILKGSKPWSPQTKSFDMTVPPNAEPQDVTVYGYGFAGTPENHWDSLTHSEQTLAHTGGITTVLIELCAPILSVVTNTSVTVGKEEIAKRIGGTVVGMALANGTLVQQLSLYAKSGDPWGLSWTFTKWAMNEIVANTQFRNAFISATGMALTSASLSKLVAWLSMPAKVVMTFNSVSSSLKTVMGFSGAQFSTNFSVWQSVLETGAVRGQVADSVNGSPLADAVVTLEGDDDNPLNPTHQITTGADGRYYFGNITVGQKTVSATKSGYAAKTVTVTVLKDQEVIEHLPLARHSGGLTGKVLNGILVHHGVQPSQFVGTVELEAKPASGGSPGTWNVTNGTYALMLSTGSWWIKATHDDYRPDSFQVSIPASGSVAAPRDLVLHPLPTMSGNIHIDMASDGTYEQSIPVSFPNVGLATATDGQCESGSTTYAFATAVRGSSQANYDAVYLGFRVPSITETGSVPVGAFYEWPCSANSGKVIAFVSTTRQTCTAPGESAPMTFTFQGEPSRPGCDCGITAPGNLYLTDWGTGLGDLVAGWITVDLHGWAGCYCSGDDTDQDGIDDDYEVSCARARVQFDFRFLVGTDYLVTWVPGAPGLQ